MSRLKLILTFICFYNALANYAVKEATLLIKEGRNKEAIEILEKRFNETDSNIEQGEIAYLISLNPEFETQKSMSYYIQNALEKYVNLNSENRARLSRILADKSFETGDLSKALTYYDISLNYHENSNLADYLTLQKTWVLVNLGRTQDALKLLHGFITKSKSQIMDTLVYDFGRLYSESLKNSNKLFSLNNIPSQEELISGLYSGISRAEIEPQKIITILENEGLYDLFFNFGLETKRISATNNCSILTWKLAQNLNISQVSMISKELIKCQNNPKVDQKKIEYYFTNLLSRGHSTLELALLATILNKTKEACSQHEALLKNSTLEESFNYTISNCLNSSVNGNIIKHSRLAKDNNVFNIVFNNPTYENAVFNNFSSNKDDSTEFTEYALTKLRIKNGTIDSNLLSSLEKNLKQDSIIYCFFYSQKCQNEDVLFTYKYLNSNQKIIYALDFLKAKKIQESTVLFRYDSSLLENEHIASEIYTNAKDYPGIYNDIFFTGLITGSFSKNSSMDTTTSNLLINRLGPFWKQTIQNVKTISYITNYSKNLRSIERQDYAFRSITNLKKNLAIQKWPNENARTLITNSFANLLKKTLENISKNQTEISPLIEEKLKEWQVQL